MEAKLILGYNSETKAEDFVMMLADGFNKVIAVQQRDIRKTIYKFLDIASEMKGENRKYNSILAVTVFHRAVATTGMTPHLILKWLHRTAGADAIAKYASEHLQMRQASANDRGARA